MENPNSQTFKDCLNSDFQVVTGAEPLPLRLVDVDEKSDQPHLEHFVLTFRGPLSPWLPQQTCALQHPTLGELSMFLVPLGPESGAMSYEAVFSRLRENA